jgi:hypothetical protein
MNEHDGVEFFQHILKIRFVEKRHQEYGAKRGSDAANFYYKADSILAAGEY